MDGNVPMMSKRRRIYSPPEPRKTMKEMFVRKYVNYLVPALTKISKETDDYNNNHEEIEKIVRYEADMALVVSAEGFAWSHALKHKLQQNAINVGTFPPSSTHPNRNAMLLKKISSNVISTHEPTGDDNESERAKRRKMQAEGTMEEAGMIESEEEEEEEEKEEIRRRLTYLRSLVPGGSEMMVDDFILSELGSYICCLESQVNILRSMVQKY